MPAHGRVPETVDRRTDVTRTGSVHHTRRAATGAGRPAGSVPDRIGRVSIYGRSAD